MSEYITIPRPQIHTGPKTMTVDEATIHYLRDAAIRVRSQRYWGSGVTALVSDLLDDAADALEPQRATPPPSPREHTEPTTTDAKESAK